MTRWLILGAVLVATAPSWAGDEKPKKPPPPPPPPGIRWEKDVDEAFRRSREEGRPLLLCVNALENEGANIMLATQRYPSEAWGLATRGYVCLVCNPNQHEEVKGVCSRYGWAPCATHQAALTWVLRRFSPGGDLISPQHIILEPDLGVAYRKEYFTGEEGPALFERHLSQVSPHVAYRQAGIQREDKIKALEASAAADAGALVKDWLASNDGLAAAGVLNAYDECEEKEKRLAIVEALAATPFQQVPVLHQPAEEATGSPDADPDLALAWVKSLLTADRPMGVWAAARVVVRTKDAKIASDAFRAWVGVDDLEHVLSLPATELAAAVEAGLLTNRPPPKGVASKLSDSDAELDELWRWRLGRTEKQAALHRAKTTSGTNPFSDERPSVLRAGLLHASKEHVANASDRVKALLHDSPYERVRIAAALAILRAGIAADGATVSTILAALEDPVEGPETRAEALERLGADPGDDPEQWKAALEKAVGGGK